MCVPRLEMAWNSNGNQIYVFKSDVRNVSTLKAQLTICTESYLELLDKDKPARNLAVKLISYVL